MLGNWASKYVRIAQLAGVRVSTCRSSKVGCVEGMSTLAGPTNMAFSVFAHTAVISI